MTSFEPYFMFQNPSILSTWGHLQTNTKTDKYCLVFFLQISLFDTGVQKNAPL